MSGPRATPQSHDLAFRRDALVAIAVTGGRLAPEGHGGSCRPWRRVSTQLPGSQIPSEFQARMRNVAGRLRMPRVAQIGWCAHQAGYFQKWIWPSFDKFIAKLTNIMTFVAKVRSHEGIRYDIFSPVGFGIIVLGAFLTPALWPNLGPGAAAMGNDLSQTGSSLASPVRILGEGLPSLQGNSSRIDLQPERTADRLPQEGARASLTPESSEEPEADSQGPGGADGLSSTPNATPSSPDAPGAGSETAAPEIGSGTGDSAQQPAESDTSGRGDSSQPITGENDGAEPSQPGARPSWEMPPPQSGQPPSLLGTQAGSVPEAGPYVLRYRFRPGEEVRWEVLQQARVKTTVGATTQTAESVTRSVKLWRVVDALPDGTATFQHLVETVEMWQKLTGREEVRYNSSTGQDPPRGFEAVAQSLNVPLATVTIDARGQILKRQRHPVKSMVDTEPLMTILLPENPVLPGDSWSYPYEVEIPLENGTVRSVKAAEIYKLREVKSGIAIIEVTTKVLTPINDPRLEAKLVQREREGVVRFDIATGRLLQQEIELDRRVVGFSGPASTLHYSSRLTEKLLTSSPATVQKPATGASR